MKWTVEWSTKDDLQQLQINSDEYKFQQSLVGFRIIFRISSGALVTHLLPSIESYCKELLNADHGYVKLVLEIARNSQL